MPCPARHVVSTRLLDVSCILLSVFNALLIHSSGRYPGHEMNVLEYSPHHYDQSFQTVPSSVPPTPSPEQWSSELSPHSNTSSTATSTASVLNGQHGPPPAHHQQQQQVHHQQQQPHQVHTHHSPYQIHNNRDMSSGLTHLGQLPNLGHHGLLQSQNGTDGKPVIQAAVLAGKC